MTTWIEVLFILSGQRRHTCACEWKFSSGCVWTICLRVCVSVSLCVCILVNSLLAGVCEEWIVSYSSMSLSARHLYIVQPLKSNHTMQKTQDAWEHTDANTFHSSAPIKMQFMNKENNIISLLCSKLDVEKNMDMHAGMWPHSRHTKPCYRLNVQDQKHNKDGFMLNFCTLTFKQHAK